MRFTAYNHYIHKMFQRWGPNVLESTAIRENLRNSGVSLDDFPVIGGMEINLASLYQAVKSFGGLREVIEKERWTKVADSMHVPKAAHDRATKLDGIYVKYVLPYEILSDGEWKFGSSKINKLKAFITFCLRTVGSTDFVFCRRAREVEKASRKIVDTKKRSYSACTGGL
jgi:hypothetical protein